MMKRFTAILIVALLIYFVGMLAPDSWSLLRCERRPVTKNWLTYVNEAGGYRLRYPEGWKLRSWDADAYLCSPRLNFPCGPTPHEVYATVGVDIRDSEGLQLREYLVSPARGYKDLKEVRVGDVQGFSTGPVGGDSGWFKSGRYIDEQVHFLKDGKVYTIISYAVDGCPKEFEQIRTTFEFTKVRSGSE